MLLKLRPLLLLACACWPRKQSCRCKWWRARTSHQRLELHRLEQPLLLLEQPHLLLEQLLFLQWQGHPARALSTLLLLAKLQTAQHQLDLGKALVLLLCGRLQCRGRIVKLPRLPSLQLSKLRKRLAWPRITTAIGDVAAAAAATNTETASAAGAAAASEVETATETETATVTAARVIVGAAATREIVFGRGRGIATERETAAAIAIASGIGAAEAAAVIVTAGDAVAAAAKLANGIGIGAMASGAEMGTERCLVLLPLLQLRLALVSRDHRALHQLPNPLQPRREAQAAAAQRYLPVLLQLCLQAPG